MPGSQSRCRRGQGESQGLFPTGASDKSLKLKRREGHCLLCFDGEGPSRRTAREAENDSCYSARKEEQPGAQGLKEAWREQTARQEIIKLQRFNNLSRKGGLNKLRQLSKTKELPKSCRDCKVLPLPHHRTVATKYPVQVTNSRQGSFARDSYQKPSGERKKKKTTHSWCALALKGRTIPSITLQQQSAQLQTGYFRVTASCSPG